jgi:hypothetical protein
MYIKSDCRLPLEPRWAAIRFKSLFSYDTLRWMQRELAGIKHGGFPLAVAAVACCPAPTVHAPIRLHRTARLGQIIEMIDAGGKRDRRRFLRRLAQVWS